MKLKENENEAREHTRAFWAGSSLGRPSIYIAPKRKNAHYELWQGPTLTAQQADESPEWQAYRARQLQRREYMAEAFPYTFPWWGCQITYLAHLTGKGHTFHKLEVPDTVKAGDGLKDPDAYFENSSAWIRPMRNALDMPTPVFDPAHPAIKMMERNLEAMAASVGNDGIVGPPPMLDGMTTLSEFITQADLCYALIERPDDVKRWVQALDEVGMAAYEHFYNQLLSLGYGDTSTWLQPLAEGRFEAVQCDFAVMLSPAMFEEFVVPQLIRATEYYDYNMYHLDGTCQMRFLDALQKIPNLKGIQWNPEPNGTTIVEWIPALQEIRRRGWILHVWCNTIEEAVAVTKAVGPDGLFISLRLMEFETTEEAQQAIDRIAAAV